jgi:hypothetical protein
MNQDSKPMTPSEMGKKGAKNRWAKHTPEERSEMMRGLANIRWSKNKKNDK